MFPDAGSTPAASTILRFPLRFKLRMASQSFKNYYLPQYVKQRMKYVYLIQSVHSPNHRYIGLTSNVEARLKAHNEGRSSHTSKFKLWELVTYLAFSDESKAVEFEQYLKSGSGRAFSKRRLW